MPPSMPLWLLGWHRLCAALSMPTSMAISPEPHAGAGWVCAAPGRGLAVGSWAGTRQNPQRPKGLDS